MLAYDVRVEVSLVLGLVVAERAVELGLFPALEPQVSEEVVVVPVELPALVASVLLAWKTDRRITLESTDWNGTISTKRFTTDSYLKYQAH